MKAVFLNTMISLLCLASVVLAAPHQSISLLKNWQNTQNTAIKCAEFRQDPCVTACVKVEKAPLIIDGEARFACW